MPAVVTLFPLTAVDTEEEVLALFTAVPDVLGLDVVVDTVAGLVVEVDVAEVRFALEEVLVLDVGFAVVDTLEEVLGFTTVVEDAGLLLEDVVVVDGLFV